MDTITIRRLTGLDEYTGAERLQQECWQAQPIEAVPANLMITLQNEAGLVLGAFTPEERLVGFLLGFLGRQGDRLKHCSHMAAVLPEYRNRNIAYRMKWEQRTIVRAQGIDLITWTFDPLQFPNALLNIAKLGAVSRLYKRNVYGYMRDLVNGPLPTDRLYATWELNSARVAACAQTGARVAAPVADNLLTVVRIDNGVPRLAGSRPPAGDSPIGIQIPRDLGAVRSASVDTALEWRAGTRALFEAAFAAGYTVVNVSLDADAPHLLGRYTLVNDP